MKNFKIGVKWKRVVLDGKDVEKIREELRKSNLKIMEQCMKDACKLFKTKLDTPESAVREYAVALFNKLADQQFTRVQARLDEMVEEEREKFRATKEDIEEKMRGE